jgi:hypothetical protein
MAQWRKEKYVVFLECSLFNITRKLGKAMERLFPPRDPVASESSGAGIKQTPNCRPVSPDPTDTGGNVGGLNMDPQITHGSPHTSVATALYLPEYKGLHFAGLIFPYLWSYFCL